eukprot:CAMPEP_0202881618 /NCGR_PEP_ID=MMETSP1391-20130828/36783_1 /ASSEMBLY_ACC=CAM_ASM_000867 /TAXON_ID=1034604 /ORGANISM="Chlamydomonas leiostraca, Strain SAG 11-49" /LENGTH=63 /DNA_ID=CAMNT_0049564331 /DNA_START=24 /DNA_END=215 /DNA_ORIENTATION=-
MALPLTRCSTSFFSASVFGFMSSGSVASAMMLMVQPPAGDSLLTWSAVMQLLRAAHVRAACML